ncbi:probable serine/threonine-protein kinase DDB_G0271538 [Haliotis rubra]|uniref:probable serine/threonine-protein kinase DDB_G0271538 n=1 Tax=Haliotis rubra TaxID=36100 RepID=UPI001EE5CC22|nr:probable serine/threonine-protein kinase DDB_G0271538 [Haliotis rubra]
MLRVFGFDPRVSPFTVNGYPLLPSMSEDLDHIDLPILEKRDVRFARKDDGMFVCVGQGAYGRVYLAEMSGREGKLVVKDYINEGVTWEVIQHEARLLKYLTDTNFVPEFVGLITSSASEGGHSLVQEYFGNGLTILKLLQSQDELSKTTWMSICCQLAEGLQAIHAKHVLLNDVKSDNVLVDLTSGLPEIRYIDVGMATYRQGLQFECSRPHIDDHNYLAPEVCMGSHSSPLSDIYSLGHLLGHIGRKSQIPELESVSQSCTQQLPIDRMSLTTVRAELDLISSAVGG